MTYSCKDIENFKGVNHLYLNKKFHKKPTVEEINFISELSEIDYQNKHQFTKKCQELQKKYHLKPRQSRINLIYRTLLQQKKANYLK